MKPTVDAIRALLADSQHIVLTRVAVRLPQKRGGYVLDVEGPISDVIEAMAADLEIAGIESISGVVSVPSSGHYAFRIDASGLRIAANTPPDVASQTVVPTIERALSVAA